MNCEEPKPTGSELLGLRASLQALYEDLAREIAQAQPICDLSGRCCRFSEWDHTLFLSGIEATILLADAPPSVRPLDEGATCPWQNERGHCTAREARPLGCRVYFCDPNYQETGQSLSEHYLKRLKRLADEYQLPWAYAPLHRHLQAAKATGVWRSFEASQDASNAANPLTLL